jgi:lipoprotein-anchoring transpeptidase ErfK/SrfK
VKRRITSFIVAFCSLVVLGVPSNAAAEADPDLSRASRVVVDLSEQRAYVYDGNGTLKKVVLVSTGGPGNRTRIGTFHVTSRTRVGRSGGDYNVRMDYFTRFDKGIGFHGIPWRGSRTNRLATPLGKKGVSHGCVRMADSNARWLYLELKDGDQVVVQR